MPLGHQALVDHLLERRPLDRQATAQQRLVEARPALSSRSAISSAAACSTSVSRPSISESASVHVELVAGGPGAVEAGGRGDEPLELVGPVEPEVADQ